MACKYINNKAVGKILIPDCMGVAVYQDLDYCTCQRNKKSKIEILESKIFVLENRIKELESLTPTTGN